MIWTLLVLTWIAKDVNAARFDLKMSPRCSYWIYVYDLPHEFNTGLAGYVMADPTLVFPNGVYVEEDALPEGLYSQVLLSEISEKVNNTRT